MNRYKNSRRGLRPRRARLWAIRRDRRGLGATVVLLVAAVGIVALLAGCVSSGPFAPDYRSILEGSPPYSLQTHLPELSFSYQPPDDPELVRLRETFHLDDVAGDGTDSERIVRLMEWVHEALPHDGRSNPPAWNTFEIIRFHEETGRGVNCRKLAIALSEIYLAVGYPARHVTCKPQPTQFSDCHVVTAVWLPDEERWVMMDPSFRAYVTDESGTILGVPEFREALRTGSAVSLKRSPRSDRWYFGYMTKNLYRYDLPVVSTFGYEAPGGDTFYVEVVPTGYGRTGVHRGQTADGSVWSYGVTDNPREVWGVPPRAAGYGIGVPCTGYWLPAVAAPTLETNGRF